ncbi:CLUMA_CG015746, isoform A [Clunio marinus]|uniref:Small ribosomal subunit protein uS10m n=1 Tax=Clunio marinus TaxID=568069 RepID=A0A1J1IQP8_9DIPT|nr:CLUMA_CG015746, isoform A [Clunio marinus]
MFLLQKSRIAVSSFSRIVLPYQNSFGFSSELQPRSNENKPENVEEAPEKDRLYSHLEIELKGIEPEVMKSYVWFAKTAAKHLDIEVGKCYAPKKSTRTRWSILKSIHVHAKHHAQYEVRTYYYFLNFHNLTQSTLETYLEYIQRNLPEGTGMKATKVELQAIPEHIKVNPS